MSRGRLDREIVGGGGHGATDALALRARQLTEPPAQQKLARSLRAVVEYVDRGGSRGAITAVVIEPGAVMRGRRALLDLAEQLERAGPVTPRGMVLARRLLSEGVSPLFNPYAELTVTEAVLEVADALAPAPVIDDLAA